MRTGGMAESAQMAKKSSRNRGANKSAFDISTSLWRVPSRQLANMTAVDQPKVNSRNEKEAHYVNHLFVSYDSMADMEDLGGLK